MPEVVQCSPALSQWIGISSAIVQLIPSRIKVIAQVYLLKLTIAL